MTSGLDQERRKRRGMRVTGAQAGVVIAIAAVAAGAFFTVRPPDAYGICMACHGRDLVNGLANVMADTRLTVAQASAVFPLLTTVGVLVGASAAALAGAEFRVRRTRNPLRNFVHGVVVMNFALLAAGCASRLALRTSAGDWLGVAGFGAMVVGVVLGTHWVRWRAQR
jgi:hypothetical protein